MVNRRNELATPSVIETQLENVREELFDHNSREKLAHAISGRRSQLQRQGQPLGDRLFAETSEQIVARIGEY